MHKSSSQKAVCFVLPARRHMCTSPKHNVGLSLWSVSLKVFGSYSNLKENVSNNFKYSYLIYWAFMFLPQMGCYGLRRNLRRDYKYMHFLSNLNHDKKLVSEIDCSCRYIIFLNQCIHLFGSALDVVHNMLTFITYLIWNIWTNNIILRTWLLVKNSMKWSDVKRKRPRPMLSDVGLLKSFA